MGGFGEHESGRGVGEGGGRMMGQREGQRVRNMGSRVTG